MSDETPATGKPRTTIFDLILRILDDALLIVRSEFRLAWSEVRTSLGEAASSLALVVVGAMLLGVALVFVLGGLLVWLAQYVGVVAAALIAAAIAIILGGLTLYTGVSRLKAGERAQKQRATGIAAGAPEGE